MTVPRIRALIVDDEPLARARLRGLLAKHADVQVVGECAEGVEAMAAIDRMHPEVVFLDIQMTETSGLDVATSLGVETRPAIVFVTAHERYALEAFGAEALDYLLKPFEEERFAATLDRVRTYASARRAQRSHEHLVAILRELSVTPLTELERLRSPAMPLRFADLEADTTTREVRRSGRAVTLRPKEYELLVALMRRGGALVTRRELLAEVWQYHEDVSSRTVDTHVAVLRKKLGHAQDESGYIVNAAKVGYRLRE
ncbi:MAG TPA: winged helix-turn-helix domain-containing protein [Gemmatimonadales bacterium]|nr:winged helix-turn-helix domain-containing protein [Gemmatimonadales bacterium]